MKRVMLVVALQMNVVARVQIVFYIPLAAHTMYVIQIINNTHATKPL